MNTDDIKTTALAIVLTGGLLLVAAIFMYATCSQLARMAGL